jgi:hypothetical protein
VSKESVEEIASMEAESMFKEGEKHDNFIRIWCRKAFTGSMAPLQHNVVWDKVVHKKLAFLTFIYDG